MDGLTPLEETLEALDKVRSGKVRYVGSSNYSGWQLMKALGVSERLDCSATSASRSTTLCRPERLSTNAPRHRPGVLHSGWGPLSGGLLSGKYRRDRDAQEGRHLEGWDEPPVYDPGKLCDIVDVLVEIAEGHGVSAARVALSWLLGRPGWPRS